MIAKIGQISLQDQAGRHSVDGVFPLFPVVVALVQDLMGLDGGAALVPEDVIAQIDPLPGAKEFLDELRATTQAVIVSDTFEEFAQPLMKKLGWPTILCNSLEIDRDGMLTGIKMRCEHSKLTTVRALQSIGYETIASGDSYNDLEMILASKAGFLFRSTDKIKADYPQLPAFETYDELLNGIKAAMA